MHLWYQLIFYIIQICSFSLRKFGRLILTQFCQTLYRCQFLYHIKSTVLDIFYKHRPKHEDKTALI